MLSTPFSTRQRIRMLAAAGLGLAGGLRLVAPAGAHQDSDDAGTPAGSLAITLRAMDFSFETPSEVPAGWVHVTLTNDGVEDHHAQLMALPEGMTAEGALTLFATEGEDAALAALKLVGGPGTVAPGGVSEAVVWLEPGEHLVTCFIAGADGIPHLAKGMVASFTVTAGDTDSQAPEADVSIPMVDFMFSVPAELEAGRTVFEVVNDGTEPHEFNLSRLNPGVTPSDLLDMLSAPPAASPAADEHQHSTPDAAAAKPPVTSVGGFQGIYPGGTGYAIVELEPATYVATCFIPSFANGGAPHAMLGMVAFFDVK